MKKNIFLSVFFFIVFTSLFAQGNHRFRKIHIVESNNYLLSKQYTLLSLPDSINTEAAATLRNYVENNGLSQKKEDINMILSSLQWVSSRWTHDGHNPAGDLTALDILKNASQGMRYRCVEYGKVLAEVLKSFGFVSRQVYLRAIDAAYGPPGSGHVATEVWCDDLQKWIFIDPQFCIFFMHKGTYLNYYEIYKLKAQGKFSEVEFHLSKGYTGFTALGISTAAEHISQYREFLFRYFGSIGFPTELSGRKITIMLLLETKDPHLSFQGLPTSNLLFTTKQGDFYFPVNQTSLLFRYQNPSESYDKMDKLYADKVIVTGEDQYNNMYQYAAKPDMLIFCDNNMPWFDHYEVFLNGKSYLPDSEGYFKVSFKEGINEIRAFAVNKNGKRGSETRIKIVYDY